VNAAFMLFFKMRGASTPYEAGLTGTRRALIDR
jgi:hypothetical protein